MTAPSAPAVIAINPVFVLAPPVDISDTIGQLNQHINQLNAERAQMIHLPPYIVSAIEKRLAECPTLYPGWTIQQYVESVLADRLFGKGFPRPGEEREV